ncbi:unnamed protein product [Wuchereria bancrofti]|uniref:Uncharacterized protein n=1 Tax=Wuchereria bancrofti TaxID=6293 RepID=A0A3P7EHA1_WUCBA|nr:unnamed protein product [Wuchereria bancrofti]
MISSLCYLSLNKMSQRAFFSTAGSEIMGQSQILEGLSTTNIGPAVTSVQFQSSGCSTSVLYQSTVTPTFYTSTGSPFHSNGAFLPPAVDDRKEYVAVLPAGVQINDASGLIPASGRGTLASVGTVDTTSSVAQLTAVPLSHVQLAPVQLANDGQSNTQQQIIYEHYYVDQQHPSTSSTINATSRGLLSETTSSGAENGKDFANKSGSSETCSLSGSDTAAALQLKRQKQADAARQRYQRMTLEERKEVNQKRTEAQKRKRQKDKELGIQGGDVVLAALFLVVFRAKKNGMDEEKLRQHIIEQNAKKAEAARLRYHRMTDEEKRQYNQRRTEAFRRRRIEEEILLSTPAGRISAEALNRAQQIMLRNAKRAEAARLRYQRMTPEQRRAYNQKRSRAKKERERVMRAASEDAMSSLSSSINGNESSTQVNSSNTAVEQKPVTDSVVSEEVLSTLERDVLKRTRQANMVLMRQKRLPPQEQFVSTNPDGTQTVIPATTTEDGKQIFHIPATATTTEDGKQVFHIPAITQQLISADPNTLTLVDDSSKLLGTAQQPLQITSVPQLLGLSQQQHSNSHDHGETSHQVAMTQQQQIIPQLAELHNVQEGGGGADDAQHTARENQVDAHGQIQAHQQQSSQQHMQQQTQPQHIIVTLQEPQQPMQHQIIVTDLNQATGAVLSSMSGHGRSRGRPPMYAAAAAAIQQQQGGVMLPPGQAKFVTITATPMISETEIKPPYRVTAPRHINTAPSRRDILAVATAASVGPTTGISPEQKLEIQRAKRAERARLRYHNMSAEERRNFNARRAKALRTARMRDDELCRMAERAQMSGTTLDADLMIQVAEAQRRRAKRAEAARLKYHRMSSEERRQYNAMRDAQRRQRKRQKEEQELLERERQQQEQQQQQQQNEIHQETREQDANREGNNEQILYDSYIRYDSQMDHGWAVQS